MKLVDIFVITLGLIFYSCDNQGDTKVYDYKCDLPSEIPAYFKNGEPVEWDCLWNDYYKSGEVQVVFDEEGDLIGLARKVTGDWTPPNEGTQVEVY